MPNEIVPFYEVWYVLERTSEHIFIFSIIAIYQAQSISEMQEPMKYSIENTSTGGRRVMVKMKKKVCGWRYGDGGGNEKTKKKRK